MNALLFGHTLYNMTDHGTASRIIDPSNTHKAHTSPRKLANFQTDLSDATTVYIFLQLSKCTE